MTVGMAQIHHKNVLYFTAITANAGSDMRTTLTYDNPTYTGQLTGSVEHPTAADESHTYGWTVME